MQETTWILIADARIARIFERSGKTAPLCERNDLRMTFEHSKSSDINSDRPGRTHESVGPARSAMEPPTDPHRELKRRAARDVSAMLLAQLNDRSYDKLVVVAPPTFLGDLRGALPDRVTENVTAQFPKDMTTIPSHDLKTRIVELLEAARWA